MANISTPTVTLGATSAAKRDVTVAGTMTFDASDVGRTYQLEISLYGEDLAGDALPADDSGADDLISTYMWPAGSLFLRPYRVVTVTAAGAISYSEKRAIDTSKLDEDPGKVVVGMADIHTPVYMPRADEVYARVTLGAASVTKRSATVQSGIGV
jgi:preprotein translocase subunit Sec61beta